RRHTRFSRDWSSDVCSSDLTHRTQQCVVLREQRIERAECCGRCRTSEAPPTRIALECRRITDIEADAHGIDEAFAERRAIAQARSEDGPGGREGRRREMP